LLAEQALAACANGAYTGAMRTVWKKIRYRLEWLGLKSATKFLPLLSRIACYRLALLLGSLGAMLADSKWKVKSFRACCPNRNSVEKNSTQTAGELVKECSHHDGRAKERAAAL